MNAVIFSCCHLVECATPSPQHTGLRRADVMVVVVVARAGVWIESSNMAAVTTVGSRTATRGPGEVRRCGKRTGKDGRIK